ncbi:hypothetical protein, partial [Roseibium sp. RKSG952]|uniref:hypothetical protein n=1 Tax=Roseibium sp. RKSG952 TaxID=2529384 RepID=UPI0018AD135C
RGFQRTVQMIFGRVVDLGASSLRDAVGKLIEYAVYMDDADALVTARRLTSVMSEAVTELQERIEIAEKQTTDPEGFTP